MKGRRPNKARKRIVWVVVASALFTATQLLWSHSHFKPTQPEPDLVASPYQDVQEWPKIERPPLDPVIEQRIKEILGQMTLLEKVSQMTQAEIDYVVPDQLLEYPLGSVLNGGNSKPSNFQRTTLQDWLDAADAYWLASQQTRLQIPIMWGTDAVHGHNNVSGATIFPHNIGLGATANPALIRDIGRATAGQVIASGLDWTFAPTLAIVQDPRWGRTYESFSQSSDWVYPMAKAAVEGLKGSGPDDGILATAKHFIGDGATINGVDQGNVMRSEDYLRNVQAQGYYAALEANVQTVMVSFSSWKTKKMHEHQYLLTDVLKQQMGFDGLVISDYNGIEQAFTCSRISCPQAVNAGIDLFMVPSQWRHFIDNTVAQVEAGEIPMSRIDDAVTRILRVKFRAGLFDKPMPSQRTGAGNSARLNSPELNELARSAVQQSLVLLKNNEQTLPLARDGHYVLLGEANSISRQSGGWSISWQGTGLPNELFGEATSIEQGIREILQENGGRLSKPNTPDLDLESLDGAILVMSERSYAEMMGDMQPAWQTTAAFNQTGFIGQRQFAYLQEHLPDVPLTIVLVAGRPLWVNPQLNAAEAFVMAWLPGTQGAGVADGLFGLSPITGRLPINWPADDCARNPASESKALFPIGYGLTLEDDVEIGLIRPSKPAKTWGTNGLAPACLWHNNWTTPFR